MNVMITAFVDDATETHAEVMGPEYSNLVGEVRVSLGGASGFYMKPAKARDLALKILRALPPAEDAPGPVRALYELAQRADEEGDIYARNLAAEAIAKATGAHS